MTHIALCLSLYCCSTTRTVSGMPSSRFLENHEDPTLSQHGPANGINQDGPHFKEDGTV